MNQLERLDADHLRQAITSFKDALREHEAGINRLNVYPVPDGDTGTNMALTLTSVAAELEDAAPAMATTCKAISHGSLMGARGNSGVILSQILRGFTATVAGHDSIDATVFVAAFEAAARGAYEAVGNPVEGTILTVVREAAEGAAAVLSADPDASLLAVAEGANLTGHDALARTPEMLPVLAEAGVVDAGGTGLLLLFAALLQQIDGRDMPAASETDRLGEGSTVDVGHGHGGGDHGGGGLADLRYEVMYFLEAPDEAIPAFKDVWAGIGDSIVVVGGEGIWNCHIHTDDIGASIEAAIEIGRPTNIRVTDLLEQVEEERWVREASVDPEPEPDPEPCETAVVAIATGEGIRRIFHSLGVQSVLTGGQSMNPSTAQILEAVEASPADSVVILPNNKNIIAVAEQVDATTSKTVRVVPTKGIPEGFAALISYDPEAEVDVNADAMRDAAASVVAGEVTVAVRASSCEVGPIAEGDHLGIGRSGIRAVAQSASEAAIGLISDLIDDGHEILTLIEGEGATAGETRRITEWMAEHHPGVETEIHHGGQPLYPYFVSIE